jgi:hypothetical protein
MPQDNVSHKDTPIQARQAVEGELPDAEAEETVLIEFTQELEHNGSAKLRLQINGHIVAQKQRVGNG